MKTKPLTFLLSLTFLFLFCGSVYGEDDLLKSFKKETTSPLSNTGKCQYINGWKGLPVEDMVASPDEKHVLFLEKDENNGHYGEFDRIYLESLTQSSGRE